MLKRLGNWLDDRTSYRAVIKVALEEPVPGGASFAYVWGSVLTFVLLLQMTTGVFLAMYYSPSSTDAWGSVAYIQDQVTLGWFVRGLHSYGASAMVILCGVHMLQTALYGAYKKPREVNWLLGSLMLALVLAFALTGYLLPWDQTGYWATQVATGIAGSTPLAGDQIQAAAQGGNEYGNLTLTRFFALHVFILPGALIGLVVLHIALFRKHGITPKWNKTKEQLAAKMGRFWPDQLFRDMIAIAVAFAGIVIATVYTGGASLDGPADPSTEFDARPEWYFRPLFQALKYFSGTMETIVALGLPVVVGGILFAMPFLDKGDSRDPRRRIKYLAPLLILFVAGGALTVVSYFEDADNAVYQKNIRRAECRAIEARALAKTFGVPTSGGLAVYDLRPDLRLRALYSTQSDVAALGAGLFDDHCAGCHEGEDREAPVLARGYNSREWIRRFLKDPRGDEFFGVTKIDKEKQMKAVEVEGDELNALVEFIYAQTGASDADAELAARGKEGLGDHDCDSCHALEPGEIEDSNAPYLFNRGSRDRLVAFIQHPDSKQHGFGELSKMEPFAGKLGVAEIHAIVEYIRWLRFAPAPPPPRPADPDDKCKQSDEPSD